MKYYTRVPTVQSVFSLFLISSQHDLHRLRRENSTCLNFHFSRKFVTKPVLENEEHITRGPPLNTQEKSHYLRDFSWADSRHLCFL
uniref:Uncharacterized protein n=1 Tax=Anguilla anguilla TaxID=7936 RepID=A0A0E9X4N8_ANGAN